jgi:hypothetical protein
VGEKKALRGGRPRQAPRKGPSTPTQRAASAWHPRNLSPKRCPRNLAPKRGPAVTFYLANAKNSSSATFSKLVNVTLVIFRDVGQNVNVPELKCFAILFYLILACFAILFYLILACFAILFNLIYTCFAIVQFNTYCNIVQFNMYVYKMTLCF